MRRSNIKFPIWRNTACIEDEAVNNRTSVFRIFRVSHLMFDFSEYRRVYTVTRRILKKAKHKS